MEGSGSNKKYTTLSMLKIGMRHTLFYGFLHSLCHHTYYGSLIASQWLLSSKSNFSDHTYLLLPIDNNE